MSKKTLRVRIVLSTLALTLSLNTAAEAFTGGSTAFPPTQASEALSMPGGLFGWLATRSTEDTTTIVAIGK